MRNGPLALVMLLVLAMWAGVVVTAGPSGASASDAGDALVARFPTDFEGEPVDASEHQSDWLFEGLDDQDGDRAKAVLVDFLAAHDRTLEDLVIAEAEIDRDPDFETVVVYHVPGVEGADLLTQLVPALSYWFDDPRSEQRVFGSTSALLISDGPDPLSYPAFHVLYAAGDLVFDISGTEPMLPSVLDWVAGWPTTEVVTSPPSSDDPTSGASPDPKPTTAPEPQTAGEAIIADVDAGIIDAPTGLLYRIYALTQDPLLPESYATYPSQDDDTVLDEVATTLETLPQEIQAVLAPYVVRPTDPRSIFHGDEDGVAVGLAMAAAGGADAPSIAQGGCVDGWTHQASVAAPLVVWVPCDDFADDAIERTLGILDTLYPSMTKLMGDAIPDRGGPADGGDTSIDVYVVDRSDDCATGRARIMCIGPDQDGLLRAAAPLGPGPAATSSGYLILDGARLHAPDLSVQAAFKGTVAHELFHLLSHAHNMAGTRIGNAARHWFTEASAVWAEHHFVPEARETGPYTWFYLFQLDHVLGLPSTTSTDEYAAFLWPYFMEQERGAQAIADAWEAMRGKVGHAALDDALSSVVPFESRFREFAVRAWNETLESPGGGEAIDPRFQALDAGMPLAMPFPKRTAADLYPTDGAPPMSVPVSLDPLNMLYREYDLASRIQQLVLDFTGLHAASDLDVDALLRLEDGWTRRELPDGQTRLCRERPADDADHLILVIANHSTTRDLAGAYTVEPLAEPCPEIFGTMREVQTWDRESYVGEWTATFRGGWEVAPSGTSSCDPGCVAYVPVGTVDWTWDSALEWDRPPGCHNVQSGSLPAGEVIVTSDQMLYLAQADDDHLKYWGSGAIFMDSLECTSWSMGATPNGFFNLEQEDPDAPPSDESTAARPQCSSLTWRIERDATRITGTCWLYDEPGYEHRVEWDLERILRP